MSDNLAGDKPQASTNIHGRDSASSGSGSAGPDKVVISGTITNRPPLVKNFKKPSSPGALAKLSGLRVASKRPLPTETGNGTYIVAKTQTGLREDLKHLTWANVKTVLDLAKSKKKGGPVDDRTMLMERVIQLVAGLPTQSRKRELLTSNFVTELWESLEHPPALFVGDKFQYRMADGSYNNIHNPTLGAAGTTYARTVHSTVTSPAALPDPGMVFDSVMRRREGKYKSHPNNVSSVLWYWATIIIHDLFWTDHTDPNKSKTSSYLDLSPLYGSNQQMQDTIRTFRDGRLKPDAYADKRLLGMPPGVSVLLIMFNRFHNYVAENLAAINEGNRFPRPAGSPDDEGLEDRAKAAWAKYDNDLFQTARLVTSGLYINITLVDYVRNIVNLNRADTTFTLDPRLDTEINSGTTLQSERGTGNVVSAEFNLCYRWHSCISAKDEKWIEDFYHDIFGKPAAEATMMDLMGGFVKFDRSIPDDPGARTFGGFTRGADGRFDDDELVDCMNDAVEDVAGAFGANNVPPAMRCVEVLGMLQSRKWNLAGLNEFRKHFGLKPYEKFEDINPDPEVADSLRHLYQHPDFVELYPGIVAEAAKDPLVPGVGIAPTYTISRVVLSDAVVLVRGDRHYTVDYGPKQLTNWGHKEVSYDLNVNHGCVFYKLFIRAFPNHYKQNSVYAHYPMVVPAENLAILKSLKRDHLFDFARPTPIPQRINITSYGGAQQVLEKQDTFKVTWNEGLGFLMGEPGNRFMLSGDTPLHARQRQCMGALLYHNAWKADVKAFYASTVKALLDEKSYVLAGKRQVDIIHDVGNIVHTHFAARVFNLPLKTTANPKGVYSEQELYMVLALIFVTIFFDIDPVKSFPLRQATKEVCTQLGSLIESNVKLALGLGMRAMFSGPAPNKKAQDSLAAYGINMTKGLHKSGLDAKEIAWSQILPTAGAMVPNQAEVFAQAVDFFLTPAGSVHIPDIHRIANEPESPENDALLLGYAMEGIRLAGTFGSYRKAAVADVIKEDDGREVPVKVGDRVFVSFVSAARDPVHFPDPDTVNPRRPLDKYIHYGAGPHACLGRDISQVAIVELFRALFRHKNVRRVPGPQGELKKVPRPGGFFVYMMEDWSSYFPFPTTMKVMWDEIEPVIRVRRAIHANDQLLVRRILASHPHLLHNPDTSDAGLSNSNLHLAASLGHLHICQLLIERGHEKDGPALNENHETALMLAARAGHIEVVHYLCQAGAAWILGVDVHGRDAIMEASRGGHDTIVQILLTYIPSGPEEAVRRADNEGNTALHFASSNGHLLVLRTLLAAGADADHKNIWCWTPVAYSASVQAEVYLKNLINQTKAAMGQPPIHAPMQTQASPRKGRLGAPDMFKRGQLGAMASGLRLVREDSHEKARQR
ncbi:prostaglandin-endoperoxide synthase 1 [Sporothrix brasiliensis 5110]|uniref:Prostaglandin-endoperoxide synthase 1 n=1 Tax=Sporothrix brasiliensis 5110 TaxID=1398154 RepID=A0A0C2J471_9PEZI|nr:prostaglandin-endoperoxide synthase 1 [Sporothrix brasiliensis 5110]KIH93820.1 prostaglandin-endoperoxide synthase 1 [Sporothrix brasiliensis 5110]